MKALIGADIIDGTGGPVLKDSAILIDDERITEVSRMLSGSPDSATARDHAAELLTDAVTRRR